MVLLTTALAFFFLLTGLILLHELGHFLAAQRAGVTVEEFGFGLPPRAKTLFYWRGTRFSLNWIPFGGFVRLKGESALTERERKAHGSFGKASFLARCVILVGGVAMNFLLALLIFQYGFSRGQWIPTYTSFESMQEAAERGEIQLELQVLIEQVLPDGGAAESGISGGSLLLEVEGKPVKLPSEVLALQEGKERVTYLLQPSGRGEPAEVTVRLIDGRTGVFLNSLAKTLAAPPRSQLEALHYTLREALVVTEQTVLGIAKLLRSVLQSGTVPEGITGIVGIARLTYASVQEGLSMYLRLVALLSLSLAVLNILPLPALDGGRLLFVLIEAVTRRPPNRRFELLTNAFGFGFLVFLIIVVTFYDILRLFS